MLHIAPGARSALIDGLRRIRLHARRIAALGLVIALAAGARGTAAPPDPQPLSTTTRADQPSLDLAETSPLTLEQVRDHITKTEAATDLDDAVKKDVSETLRAALDRLQAAADFAERAATFTQRGQSAPQEIAQIQAELNAPPQAAAATGAEKPTRAEVELQLAEAKAAVEAAQQTSAGLEKQIQDQDARRADSPKELAAARVKLEEIERELAGLVQPPATPKAAAQEMLLRARRQAAQNEIAALESERATLDARLSLLNARLQKEQRRIADAEKRLNELSSLLESILTAERAAAELAAREQTERQKLEAANFPAVKRIAEENIQLSNQRTGEEGIPARLAETAANLASQEAWLRKLQSDFDYVQRQAEAIGSTDAFGSLLREQRMTLPNPAQLEREIKVLQDRNAEALRTLFTLDQKRQALTDFEPRVQALLTDPAVASMNPLQREGAVDAARRLLEEQRTLVSQLHDELRGYRDRLVDLIGVDRALLQLTTRYEDFIATRVLWIRSGEALTFSPRQLADMAEALAWLTDPAAWARLIRTSWSFARSNPILLALALLGLVMLIVIQPRLYRKLPVLAENVGRVTLDRFSATLEALVVTVLIVLPVPVALGLTAYIIGEAAEADEFMIAVSYGLRRAAITLLILRLLIQLGRSSGVGRTHFRWGTESTRLVRRTLRWLQFVAVPLVFIIWTMEEQSAESRRQTLGAMAFAASMLALAVAVWRILRPKGDLIRPMLARRPGGWLDRLRFFWFAAAVGLPITLALLTTAGYYYTSLRLEQRLGVTIVLLLSLWLIGALLVRWLLIAQRRLALDQARKRRAAVEAAQEDEAKPGGEASIEIEADTIDITAVSTQTRQLLRTIIAFALILGLWLTWADVLPALNRLDEIVIWPREARVEQRPGDRTPARGDPTADARAAGSGAANASASAPMGGNTIIAASPSATTAQPSIVPIRRVTVLGLGIAILMIVLTIIASKNMPGLLEITVLQRLPLQASGRYAISTIGRYLIVMIGIVLVAAQLGISWSNVQWLAAAVTVGLGFGLKEIFENFVSGIIVLTEQPVRVGDTVTVGDVTGTVSRIRMRAVYITDWDRRELIVPNREFITGRVVNWTLSDTVTRLRVPIGVGAGSDTPLVQRLLLEIAGRHPNVLKDPTPVAAFMGFGESSLDFELRVFLPSLDYSIAVRTDLLNSINDVFRDHGIEIASPQRDLHLRSVAAPLVRAIAMRGQAGGDDQSDTTASASISTTEPSPANRATSTIVDAGRISPKNS